LILQKLQVFPGNLYSYQKMVKLRTYIIIIKLPNSADFSFDW